MQSPNRPYVPQVDELRAIAALLVFFFHALIVGYWTSGHQGWLTARNPLEALVFEGHSGVSLFMVLSGYILALGTWDRPIRYRQFLANRVIRIFPLMTVLVVAAAYSTNSPNVTTFLVPFLFMQNIPTLALADPAGLTGTVWTISVEFQFYLVAPFIFRFVSEYSLRWVLPFGLFVVLIRLLILVTQRAEPNFLWQFSYFTIIGRIDQFVMGVALARWWGDLAQFFKRRGLLAPAALAVFGLGGMMALSTGVNAGGGQYAWHWWRTVQPEIEALLWGCVIAGYILLDPLTRLPLARKALTCVGLVSFSIYLLHWPILTGVYRLLPALGWALPTQLRGLLALSTFLTLPIVLSAAALSYLSIERPFLHLRRRYVEDASRTSATAQPG